MQLLLATGWSPGHKAKVVQQWCQQNFADFDLPTSGPCPHPIGAFGLWNLGFVESKACATPHPSFNALKAFVEKEWATMAEEHVRKVCWAFRPRLEAMVAAN
ncbi:Uncharacterized protein FKW44_023911, partial [Caligus rogercresseyi]